MIDVPLHHSIWHERQIPPSTCPHCGHVLDYTLQTSSDDSMDSGTLLVCLGCCNLVVRLEGGRLGRLCDGAVGNILKGRQGGHVRRMLAYARRTKEERDARGGAPS